MLKKYSLIIPTIFFLTTLSSCGFIKMDISVAVDQFTDFPDKTLYEMDPDSAVRIVLPTRPCITKPGVLYPAPVTPGKIYPPRTNYPEVKPWPANPRKPAKYKLPSRDKPTLVQTEQPLRK